MRAAWYAHCYCIPHPVRVHTFSSTSHIYTVYCFFTRHTCDYIQHGVHLRNDHCGNGAGGVTSEVRFAITLHILSFIALSPLTCPHWFIFVTLVLVKAFISHVLGEHTCRRRTSGGETPASGNGEYHSRTARGGRRGTLRHQRERQKCFSWVRKGCGQPPNIRQATPR